MGEALRTFSDKLMLKVILQLKILCTNYVNAKKIGMFDLHDAGVCDICKCSQSVMLKGKVFIPVTPGHTGSINHDVSEKNNFPHAVHIQV